jgi:hypothetical protein
VRNRDLCRTCRSTTLTTLRGGLSQIFRGAPATFSGYCTHRPAELGMYLAGGADVLIVSIRWVFCADAVVKS